MTNASKLPLIEADRRSLSRHCHHQRSASTAQRNDLLQDCEWERRMRQLNPAWNPSANELEAYL